MANPSLANQVRYVTNATGEPTDVLVPVALWEQMIQALRDSSSGLAWVDEHESNDQVLTDLQTSLRQAAAGQTLPVSQLWDGVEV